MNTLSRKTLIVIAGPTASGKTGLGIELARHYGSEIISSDSRQVYREMNIGTAVPTPEELAAAPHHMIGVRSVRDEYSCGKYETEALALLEDRFREHDMLFLVGGSGLYVDAVCKGMDDMPEIDPAIRNRLIERLANEGVERLAAELKRLDPVYYEQVDRQNPQRVIRALEVCLQTQCPFSEVRTGRFKPRNFDVLKIAIRYPREDLYKRINLRVDLMVEAGLEAEARELYPLKHLNALQTVGYQEWFDYFDGQISRQEAIELIKRNTRRYAKRQETWLRRDKEMHWIEAAPDALSEAKALIDQSVSQPHPKP